MDTPSIHLRQQGEGDTSLLLLHGLGATGEVWSGLRTLLAERWGGEVQVPDLPGHGGSAPIGTYSFDSLATALAGSLAGCSSLIVCGHSLGGVLALTLAGPKYALPVRAVCGIGIKTNWSVEDLTRAGALASKPNPVFSTRTEAAQRHLKLAGLTGLLAPDAVPETALLHDDRGWRVAFDPRAFAVGAPDMPRLLAECRTPLCLAAGEHDAMSPAATLRALRADAVVLPGLGHNAHVERPEAIYALLRPFLP